MPRAEREAGGPGAVDRIRQVGGRLGGFLEEAVFGERAEWQLRF